MNKKILALILTSAMLTSTGIAFADTQPVTYSQKPEAADSTQAEPSVLGKEFAEFKLTAKAVTDSADFTAVIECSSEADETVFVNITDRTLLVNNQGDKITPEDIKEGASVTAYQNAFTPMPMIYPPQYMPEVIVVSNDKEGFVNVDRYDDNLVNAEGTLEISLGENTAVEFTDASDKRAVLDCVRNANLAVFYTDTTRSIPALTTPSKIIILSDNTNTAPDEDIIPEKVIPESISSITVNGTGVNAEGIVDGDTVLLPVRAVAEAMGLEVKWDAFMQAVNVGTEPMGVFFKIGLDEYSKARMAVQPLGHAPVLITLNDTGVTYVPASFFTDILESEMTVDADSGAVNITYSVN